MDDVYKKTERVEKKKVDEEMIHKCRLSLEEDILVRYIDSGYFVDLRRHFRRMILVSEKNLYSKFYLKSSFAIKRDRMKHLKKYYNMIHPFSQFRFYWEIFMIVIFVMLLFFTPVFYSGLVLSTYRYVQYGLNVFNILDVILNFNTGYLHPNTKKIIMDRKNVAIHYISTWFLLEVLTIVDFYYLGGLKILRIATLLKYINRFRDYMQFDLQLFRLINTVMVAFFLWLWSTCLMMVIVLAVKDPWLTEETPRFHQLVKCFNRITGLFLLISVPGTPSLTVLWLEMICLTMGVILQLLFLAQLYLLASKYLGEKLKYHSIRKQLLCFLNRRHIPTYMTQRIVEFFNFNYQRNLYRESEIFSTMSTKLIEEIHLLNSQRFVKNIRLLQGLPHALLLRVSTLIKPEVFLPNDVILRAGLPSSAMYFISSGTVAVYTPVGKEILHLSDGDNFGETSLVVEHQTNVLSVVAADYCDMYVLTRKDFVSVVEVYPELYNRIIQIATKTLSLCRESEVKVDEQEFYDFNTSDGQEAFYRRLYEL